MIFAAPFILIALVALPAIWWLLRVTPPKPVQEVFPPYRLLLKIINRQEMANKTPWWLLLLRLLLAALVILALAQPIWRPQAMVLSGKEALAIIIDNSFAATNDWQKRLNLADILLSQAAELEKKVIVLATANGLNQDLRPKSADEMRQYIHSLQPQPLFAQRATLVKQLLDSVKGQNIDIAFLSDGLQNLDDEETFSLLNQAAIHQILWYQDTINGLNGITNMKQESGAIAVDVLRARADAAQEFSLSAYDIRGHKIATSTGHFSNGETTTIAAFNLPLELRNDVQYINLENSTEPSINKNAAMVFLADHSNRIHRVAILSQNILEMPQPLLEPLYYVIKALDGQAEIITKGNGTLSGDINTLLQQNPSVLILGDITNIPNDTQQKILDFVENGGTLIRFAGQNLANAQNNNQNDDILLPVKLRSGERQLGGIMSWASPQRLSPFNQDSIFFGLNFPEDVTVSRQILAEPSYDLFEKTWASLADGTPFITAKNQGNGKIIFIHTAADPSWSNLPLSHFFVTMLGKLITISNVANDNADKALQGQVIKQPWRVLNANGQLQQPNSDVLPLVLQGSVVQNDNLAADAPLTPSIRQPPGLYGHEQNLTALNLLNPTSEFLPINSDNLHNEVQFLSYNSNGQIALRGYLFALALILFMLDCFLVLFFAKIFTRKRHLSLIILPAITLIALSHIFAPSHVFAQTTNAPTINQADAPDNAIESEEEMVQSAGKTRLAYVITGNADIDDTSKTGFETLAQFIKDRSTINLGSVKALDLDRDELAFYQLIYWPIDATSAMPSEKAIEKINSFMHQGGTVLFDTRDQIESGLSLDNKATANTQRLRDILKGLNIPALVAAPNNHVIARSFYIMPDFPGHYRGSSLWVADSNSSNNKDPIYSGDGVSSIIITANDLAGAWAHNGKGGWKYPLIPNDQMQRVYAFRGGLNIMMYMLTGNYKADQIHVPELLKRLGREQNNE